MNTKVTDQDLVDAAIAYAYEQADPEFHDLVNSWEDWEILQIVKGSRNENQAIRKLKKQVKALSDHRQDIQAEAF